jgi:Skp family chaperone for outer membrane proteins
MKKLFFLVISLSSVAFSQDALDSECRVQAKEAAVTTYQSCVKEARSIKIDEIRKEYQEKLTELKSHYDSELKKLAPSKTAEVNSEEPQATVQLKKKTKKSKKIANQLPVKKSVTTTLPVQNVMPQETVNTDKEISTSINSNEERSYETEL